MIVADTYSKAPLESKGSLIVSYCSILIWQLRIVRKAV